MRWLGACLICLALPAAATGQGRLELRVERADGSVSRVGVEMGQGYASVPLGVFSDLGWQVGSDDGSVSIGVPGEIELALRIGSPFFHWDGVVLQLTDAPYLSRGDVFVPLQVLTDFFPRRLPDLYEFDGPNATLRAGDPVLRVGSGVETPVQADPTPVEPVTTEPPAVTDPVPVEPAATEGPSAYEGVRVVVVDAGHGGADPGAMGPGGIREKTVALGIATVVAEVLRRDPQLEVHMIRDDDTFVDLWERGEIATELKGDRPGVFVSIHANSFPRRRAATGFETYFLSEARTEHERRVSAIENAPLSFQGQDVDADEQPDLDFILRELRNLDHQHWSSLLAEMVQREMNGFHPGPNRGVKQGVLAVLTNALMPSVLVEVGYLSNDAEARLIGDPAFHEDAGRAIADAVTSFFERYPPGSGLGGRDGR